MSTEASTDDFPLTERVRAALEAIRAAWLSISETKKQQQVRRSEMNPLFRPFVWIGHQIHLFKLMFVIPALWIRFAYWWVVRLLLGILSVALLLGMIGGFAGWCFGWFESEPDLSAHYANVPRFDNFPASSSDAPAPLYYSYEPAARVFDSSYPAQPTYTPPKPTVPKDGFSKFMQEHEADLEMVVNLVFWGLELKNGKSSSPSGGSTNPSVIWHSGSNGRPGHWQTAPNSNPNDNFSTRGNHNPYTGARGYK